MAWGAELGENIGVLLRELESAHAHARMGEGKDVIKHKKNVRRIVTNILPDFKSTATEAKACGFSQKNMTQVSKDLREVRKLSNDHNFPNAINITEEILRKLVSKRYGGVDPL